MKSIFYEKFALVSASVAVLLFAWGIFHFDVRGCAGFPFLAMAIALGITSSTKNY